MLVNFCPKMLKKEKVLEIPQNVKISPKTILRFVVPTVSE